MGEKQIIQTAIKHFDSNTGLKMHELNQKPRKQLKNRVPDTNVEIQVSGKTYDFCVVVKNELRQVHLYQLIKELKNDFENWLLISQYISKPRDKLPGLIWKLPYSYWGLASLHQ
jgi:hypothetical protein